ncbi:hypothetical protein HY045_02400 [Candidatus Woesebacteria bacterium]|nr:hypothetical protein [Candidatus Woesebacteria bacterium]
MNKFLIPTVFLISFIIYFVSSGGTTPYNYFTRLAESFINGKYYITQNPPWLNELIPGGPGKYFVVYPPMPAILAIPFVFLFGANFPQQILAHIVGAGIVTITFLIAYLIKKDVKLAIWSALLAGFGTIIWFLSSVGSVWYLGQITATFFLLLAIYFSLQKKLPGLVGVFIGAAYLSRTHTILSLPLFLYFFRKDILKNWTYLALGIFPFVCFDTFYNFIRYGVVWNMSYFLLPKVLGEEKSPWFYLGVTNPRYIPDNLKLVFWSFPKFLDRFPYVQPSWAGLSIWITTPAFLYSLKSHIKENEVKIAWTIIVVMLLLVTSHGGTGSVQFGYRFAVDFYPFLIFLVIKSVAKTGLKWHHWALLLMSVLVNLWGVIWINKLGWVSF